jgi:hypothetical protein
MPSGDGYHVIMAILLLLRDAPEDEPAQQHDVANGFSNRSDRRPRERGAAQWFRRRYRAAEKVSTVSGRTCFLPEKICHRGTIPTPGRVVKFKSFCTRRAGVAERVLCKMPLSRLTPRGY